MAGTVTDPVPSPAAAPVFPVALFTPTTKAARRRASSSSSPPRSTATARGKRTGTRRAVLHNGATLFLWKNGCDEPRRERRALQPRRKAARLRDCGGRAVFGVSHLDGRGARRPGDAEAD